MIQKTIKQGYKIALPSIVTHQMENYNLQFPTEVETNKEEMLNYYRELNIMRKMEIMCDKLYKNKQIFGFCHLYDGQEATALGINEGLQKEDPLIGAYRIHCAAYLRDIPVFDLIAEMLGKQGGSTKGKGGSMHYYNSKSNFYGGNGIVGDQVPLGAGLAFAMKYKNKPNVAMTLYGDGGANQGQLYEAANMASVWKLPLLFLCENNNYAMGTSVERSSHGGGNFHSKLTTIPGIQFEGHDLFEVREVIKYAREFALENGPIFLNCKTYRYHGHSMSDPGITYRKRSEVQEVRKTKDPILLLKNHILEHEAATESQLKEIEKDTKKFIESESKRAQAQPDFKTSSLVDDVYTENEKYFTRAPNFEDSNFVQEKLVNQFYNGEIQIRPRHGIYR